MAFSYINRNSLWGTNGQTFYTSLMNDLATVSGWAIWDSSQISAAQPYFVMKVTTDEGVGNEMYFKIGIFTTNTQLIQASTFDGWNATTHVPTGNYLSNWYVHVGNTNSFIASSSATYRISGDQNAVVLTFTGLDSYIGMPMYLGGIEKLYNTTIDPALRCCFVLGEYIGSDPGTQQGIAQQSTDNRLVFLNDATQAYGGRGIILHQTPMNFQTNYVRQLTGGPWYGDRTYFSARPLVYDNIFGPRGQLRHIEEMSNDDGISGLNNLDTVTIKGQQFYTWNPSMIGDTGMAQYNNWNNRVDAASTKLLYLIRSA